MPGDTIRKCLSFNIETTQKILYTMNSLYSYVLYFFFMFHDNLPISKRKKNENSEYKIQLDPYKIGKIG